MKEVAGRVAFVTGAASGMGLAMARSFAGAGMKVALADIEEDALERAHASFGPGNADTIALPLDVTDRDAMAEAADRTEAAFGKVHVLCNNAGVGIAASFADHAYEDWDWVLGVNLRGVINGVTTFLPRIAAHGEGGHVVNTASMAGLLAFGRAGVYNTTKYAVLGMSEAMRADLADQDIGVSVLCPGFVNTAIFDSGRNRPDALAAATDNASMDLDDPNDPQVDPETREAMLAGMIEPDVVGDMVLHAVRENEAFIFSHPDFEPFVDARHAEMVASFERWRAYREKHGI